MSHHLASRARRLVGATLALAALLPGAGQAQDVVEPTAPPICPDKAAYIISPGVGWIMECPDATAVRVVERPRQGRLDTHVIGGKIPGYGRYYPSPGTTGFDTFTIEATNALGTSRIVVELLVSEPPDRLCSALGTADGFIRRGQSRTTLIGCVLPRGLAVQSPPTVGDTTVGTATIGESRRLDVIGGTLFVQPVTVTAPAAAESDVVRLSVGVPGRDAVALNHFVVPPDYNSAPACNAVTRNAEPFGSTLAIGMTVHLATCEDLEGDPFAIRQAEGPGSLRVTPDVGAFWTAPGTIGPAEVVLEATDEPPAGLQPQTSVLRETMEVQAPRCSPATLTVAEGSSVTQTLACDDVEDAWSVGLGATPVLRAADHGSVDVGRTPEGDWQVTYTPDPGFSGTDRFDLATGIPVAVGERYERTGFVVQVTPAPPRQDPPAPPRDPGAPTQPGPPAAGGGGERDRILGQMRATGLRSVMRRIRVALAKGRTSARVGPLAYDVRIAVRLTSKAGGRRAARRGAGRVSLSRDRKGTLKLSLTKAAKRTLKRKRRLEVTVQLTLTDPDTGAKATLRQGVTIKTPKPKKQRRKR